MEGSLTMNQHERERLKIIDRKRQELTMVVAAETEAKPLKQGDLALFPFPYDYDLEPMKKVRAEQ